MAANETLRQRLYIVSFGDSSKYRYIYSDKNPKDDAWHHPHPAVELEKEIREYLQKEFPGDDTLAYFYTPRLVEVEWSHSDRYAGYPELDSAAVEAIKQELRREVVAREDVAELNNDAPQSDI